MDPLPPRRLAIDFGDKRVGIAISDRLGLTAQSRPYIPNTPNLFKDLLTLIQSEDITHILIGLPQNSQNQDTQQTQKVRRFKEILSTKTALPIDFIDEAFSTKTTEAHLIAQDVSRKKRKEKIDSMSAALFLQQFLDSI